MQSVQRALLSALLSCLASAASADSSFLQGEWRQISSNAGQCADCRISIEREGDDFAVAASNGWSGTLNKGRGGEACAQGGGRWKAGSGGSYSGKSFAVSFCMADGRLFMMMTVPKEGGASRIKAVFERRKQAPDGA